MVEAIKEVNAIKQRTKKQYPLTKSVKHKYIKKKTETTSQTSKSCFRFFFATVKFRT